MNSDNLEGALVVDIKEAKINDAKSLFKADPFIRVDFINKTKDTKIAFNGGSKPKFNEEVFFILTP